jgi:hypothetical protein
MNMRAHLALKQQQQQQQQALMNTLRTINIRQQQQQHNYITSTLDKHSKTGINEMNQPIMMVRAGRSPSSSSMRRTSSINSSKKSKKSKLQTQKSSSSNHQEMTSGGFQRENSMTSSFRMTTDNSNFNNGQNYYLLPQTNQNNFTAVTGMDGNVYLIQPVMTNPYQTLSTLPPSSFIGNQQQSLSLFANNMTSLGNIETEQQQQQQINEEEEMIPKKGEIINDYASTIGDSGTQSSSSHSMEAEKSLNSKQAQQIEEETKLLN